MARKRMIDPSIWADEDFGNLSSDCQVMFIGMFSNADDDGRLPGNALFLASTIMPYRGLTKNEAIKIRDAVLSCMHSVQLYVVEAKEYLQFTKWKTYQAIDRPTASKYPAIPERYVSNNRKLDDTSTSDRLRLDPNRIEVIEEKRREARAEASLSFLRELPQTVIDEFVLKYSARPSDIKQKAQELANYCEGHGKTYKNYKAILNNACIKDFGIRKPIHPEPVNVEPSTPVVDSTTAHKLIEESRAKLLSKLQMKGSV